MKPIVLAALTLSACDLQDPPHACDVHDSDVELRDEPEEVLVTQQLVTPKHFAEIILACDDVEPGLMMLLTLSGYPVGSGFRVIGIGGSAMATLPMYECWREPIIKLGGMP